MDSYTPQQTVAPATYGSAPTYLGAGGNYSSNGGAPTGGSPDLLAAGMYQGGAIPINQNAFNNAVGAQAGQALSGLLPNYLGATTQPITATTAQGGNPADYNSGIAGQLALAERYNALASGQGPSLAQTQAEQQGASNLAQTESMLGSARGAGNPAAAELAARGALASGQQQVAGNAVLGRTQEELGALGAAGGLYGNVAGQGLQEQGLGQNLNMFNAGQRNQIAQGNQANTSGQYNNYLGALSGINAQQQQGQIAGQQLNAQTQLGQQNIENNAYSDAAARNSKLFGSLMSGAGSLASMFL